MRFFFYFMFMLIMNIFLCFQNIEYHQIIKKPIALDIIRQKLNWNVEVHYKNMDELVKDVRLMFKNAYTFNPVSKI